MKSGLGAILFAARPLELIGELTGSLTLAALVDEEELMLGVKDFVAKGYANGAIAIVCEPEAAEVCITQKGAIRLEVRFHGRIAHGAMTTKGVNRIAAIGSILAFAQETEQALQQEYGSDPQLGAISITNRLGCGIPGPAQPDATHSDSRLRRSDHPCTRTPCTHRGLRSTGAIDRRQSWSPRGDRGNR